MKLPDGRRVVTLCSRMSPDAVLARIARKELAGSSSLLSCLGYGVVRGERLEACGFSPLAEGA